MAKIKGKQIENNTIAQRNMNIVTSSIVNPNHTTNKEFAETVIYSGISNISYSTSDLNITANVTSGISMLACNQRVTDIPYGGITIFLNGIKIDDSMYFFSPDGLIVRDYGLEQKGDYLYWNSLAYDLDSSDRIDFHYLTVNNYLTLNSGDIVTISPFYNSIVVRYVGDTGTTMIVRIDQYDIVVGNISGNFVWDIGGLNEHTFTVIDESYSVIINGIVYTIWFNGFGSLIYSLINTQYYFNVDKNELFFLYSSGLTDTFTINTNGNWSINNSLNWLSFNNYNGNKNATITVTTISGNTIGIKTGITSIITNGAVTNISMIQTAYLPKFISTSSNISFELDNLGHLWGWGRNNFGQLGDNTVTAKSTPVAVCGNHTFTTISTGGAHSTAIDNLGMAWSWGYNFWGNLGNNTAGIGTSVSIPVAVCGNHTFTTISSNQSNSLAIDNLGQAWGWGSNYNGQLGDNTISAKSTPVAVCGNHTFTTISVNTNHSLAIDNLGQAWGWGQNIFGQLGDNTSISKRTPVVVCGGHIFIKITTGYGCSFGIDNLGQTWAWGINSNGILGDNSLDDKSIPVAVCGNHTFTTISSNIYTTFGIDNLGQAWGWGLNHKGQLGDNTISAKSTPVAVCGNHTFTEISPGFNHTIALDIFGYTWGWGANYNGQLGDNTIDDKLTPIRVCNL